MRPTLYFFLFATFSATCLGAQLEAERQLDCGARCIVIASKLLGVVQDYDKVIAELPESQGGVSIQAVSNYLNSIGLDNTVREIDFSSLASYDLAIIHTQGGARSEAGHFMVMYGQNGLGANIVQPSIGTAFWDAESISSEYSGVAVVFGSTQGQMSTNEFVLGAAIVAGLILVSWFLVCRN